MTLKDYLIREKKKIYIFAQEVGVSQPTCSLWVSGVRVPKPKHMQKIVQCTNGEVTPNDFYPQNKQN